MLNVKNESTLSQTARTTTRVMGRGINRVWVEERNRHLSQALVKLNPFGIRVGEQGGRISFRSSQMGWITASLIDARVLLH